MSDIIERAEKWLESGGFEGSIQLVHEFISELQTARQEIERLHSWDGLMSLLDEHYPESIFPTNEDSEDRDYGPRIVSLIRRLHGAEQDNQELRVENQRLRNEIDHAGAVCDD